MHLADTAVMGEFGSRPESNGGHAYSLRRLLRRPARVQLSCGAYLTTANRVAPASETSAMRKTVIEPPRIFDGSARCSTSSHQGQRDWSRVAGSLLGRNPNRGQGPDRDRRTADRAVLRRDRKPGPPGRHRGVAPAGRCNRPRSARQRCCCSSARTSCTTRSSITGLRVAVVGTSATEYPALGARVA